MKKTRHNPQQRDVPWRDGSCVVIDPSRHALPALCVVTGRSVDGPPRAVQVGSSNRHYAAAAAAVVVGFLWFLVSFDQLAPIWVGVGGALVGFCVAVILFERGQRESFSVQIEAYVGDDALPPPYYVRFLLLLFGPVLLLFSLWALFNVQIELGASIDRGPLANRTLAWLTLLVVSLFITIVAPANWRAAPLKPRLVCTRREGPLLWIKGCHAALLIQLPEYAKATYDDEGAKTA